MDAVVTHQLHKSYGPREVLHGIGLRIPTGSLFGFLGPNGAGKTTTIRILVGLLKPSQGQAVVLGQDSWREGTRLRAHVGYLPGDVRFYPHLTGRQTLRFLDAVRGAGSNGEIKRLAAAFDLDLNKRVRDYSRGMKQKLGLIQALMHRPTLLILDEPTVSLDPLVRETLWVEIRRAAGEGRTVLFSSHTLSEVERLCDWVGILRDGCLIEQQRIESLRIRAVRRIEVVFAADTGPLQPLPQGLQILPPSGGRWVANWTGPMQTLLAWLARNTVRELTIGPPDLEDLFLAYYSPESAKVEQ
ncbi:MAG TPA: ABC transporter ATP-binding protein [Phycisphaerae bacterium]|nr:ABC transporter ATP-binding protein [Phycisphaerae bacterium]